jgi:hypothetical protein
LKERVGLDLMPRSSSESALALEEGGIIHPIVNPRKEKTVFGRFGFIDARIRPMPLK